MVSQTPPCWRETFTRPQTVTQTIFLLSRVASVELGSQACASDRAQLSRILFSLVFARNDWWTLSFSEKKIASRVSNRARTLLAIKITISAGRTRPHLMSHHRSLGRHTTSTWFLRGCSVHAFTRTHFYSRFCSPPPPPRCYRLLRWSLFRVDDPPPPSRVVVIFIGIDPYSGLILIPGCTLEAPCWEKLWRSPGSNHTAPNRCHMVQLPPSLCLLFFAFLLTVINAAHRASEEACNVFRNLTLPLPETKDEMYDDVDDDNDDDDAVVATDDGDPHDRPVEIDINTPSPHYVHRTSSSTKSKSLIMYIGICLGVVAVGASIGFVVMYMRRRNRHNNAVAYSALYDEWILMVICQAVLWIALAHALSIVFFLSFFFFLSSVEHFAFLSQGYVKKKCWAVAYQAPLYLFPDFVLFYFLVAANNILTYRSTY